MILGVSWRLGYSPTSLPITLAQWKPDLCRERFRSNYTQFRVGTMLANVGCIVSQIRRPSWLVARKRRSRERWGDLMRNSLLVRIFGFPATLIHGDSLVLDRWMWLRAHLGKVVPGSRKLLDVGCGSGAFTIGASRLGYQALGLSWDKENQGLAESRAALCNASRAEFEIQDVRHLDGRPDLMNSFDVVLCCENIEHILDDRKLVADIANCLKPGASSFLRRQTSITDQLQRRMTGHLWRWKTAAT